MNNEVDFFGDATVKEVVHQLWANVFQASNKVIRDAGLFGFDGIELIPDPNIHQMVNALAVISGALDIMISLLDDAEINHNEVRLVLNAKKQILSMEYVAAALKSGNREDFDKAIEELKQQAPF